MELFPKIAARSMRTKNNVLPRTVVRFALSLTLICSMAAVIPASAQHFQQMEGTLTQIAAGRNEVWGIDGSKTYRFNPSSQKFATVSVPKTVAPFTQIAVGGGSLLQQDQVWGIGKDSYAYQYNFTTKTFTAANCGLLGCDQFSQIAVSYGDQDNCHPYEVWAIAAPSSGSGTYRYDYCASLFIDMQSPANFTQIAVGPDIVMAIDQFSCFWFYGSITYSQWIRPFNGCSSTYAGIAASMGTIWAYDTAGNVYNYDINTGYLVAGLGLGGLPTQIAAGGDGVWLLAPLVETTFIIEVVPGSSTVSPPALPASIAVGSGAGVWLLDTSNHVYALVRP